MVLLKHRWSHLEKPKAQSEPCVCSWDSAAGAQPRGAVCGWAAPSQQCGECPSCCQGNRAFSSVCCQVKGLKRTQFSWLAADNMRFPETTMYSWARTCFFFSLSPIIWIPIVTPSIWTSLWIFWVFFPPVLYVFFVSTTNTNLKNILFSLRLPHWSPVFSWSQQCVQNKHCLCCRWNVLISSPQALMEAGKVYCIKSH